MNRFLAAAKAYLAAGLHPIACEPRGKRPMVPSWRPYQEVAPTEGELEAWWTLWPEANVGLVLGRGVFAVDLDSPDARERLEAAGIVLPTDAPAVATGKGAHVYLAGTAPDRIGLIPGVDIRGVGYVIAPPSIHPSGREYTWAVPFPADGRLPDGPPALMTLLRRPAEASDPKATSSGQDWLTQTLVGVAEGGRDATCTRLAGYFLGKGVPEDAVEIVLQAWAERCSPPFPADEVTKCVRSIAKREGAQAGPPSRLAEVLDVALVEITAPPEKRRPAAKTGIGRLDALASGGVYPGEYIICGARPGVGKSALSSQVTRQFAFAGHGVLYVSREMTRSALIRRLLVQESGVRAEALKTGQLVDLERQMLEAAAARLRPLPIWITQDIRTTDQLDDALKAYTPGTLGLVVCDYLQLMDTAEHFRDPRQRVEAVSKALRAMSLQHELPILALSSLSRPPKNVREWKPSLADLRESGELEHDADSVWLMHRPLDQDETSFQMAKNRDGRVGEITLKFHGETLTFKEVA